MITNIHYFRPNTFDEASALLATTNTRNIAIAGATSWAYNVDINAETLIDLGQMLPCFQNDSDITYCDVIKKIYIQ